MVSKQTASSRKTRTRKLSTLCSLVAHCVLSSLIFPSRSTQLLICALYPRLYLNSSNPRPTVFFFASHRWSSSLLEPGKDFSISVSEHPLSVESPFATAVVFPFPRQHSTLHSSTPYLSFPRNTLSMPSDLFAFNRLSSSASSLMSRVMRLRAARRQYLHIQTTRWI